MANLYLAAPVKTTTEVDLTKPLAKFIKTTFTDLDPAAYTQPLNDFNKLRSNVITKLGDKHESTLEVLCRYYDQLVAIESKLPITENQIRISFKWYDAFGKDSFFGRRSLSVAAGAYEKVCILYNIAAMQSQLADSQNHDSDDGLKQSAKYFQQSSGIFQHLKECVLSHIQQDPTSDMRPDTLQALSALMLAQAQDCFFRKARKDKMKDAIIAKVAYQCADLYSEALKLLQLNSIRDVWPKEWIPFVTSKQAALHGFAEFYQANADLDNKHFGQQIARLIHAEQLMEKAKSAGGTSFVFNTDYEKIKQNLASAKKDNDFIYHETVPEQKTLGTIGKAPIAKPLSLASPMSSNFQDLLSKLVPLSIHSAMGAFDTQKSQVINMEVGRLREQTQLLNSVLASLNLPAALEDVSGGGKGLPPSVVEKAQKIREQGGIGAIQQLMQDLPESLKRNTDILVESTKLLDNEAEDDAKLRNEFGDKWTRTASNNLTEPIRAEGAKYKGIIDTATQADLVVKERYAKLKNGIELLSKPVDQLEKSLPDVSNVGNIQNLPAVQELKSLMQKVDAIKNEREVMESEIKDAKCDMSSIFLNNMNNDGIVNQQNLVEDQLDRMFSPLREQVNDSCKRQEELLAQIQTANTEFCKAKQGGSGSGADREKVLKDLAEAYDGYMELKSNLEEGNKFYNDLTQLLVRYQNKITDFCFARKTEKDELFKDVQKTIANQPAQAPPSAPGYHQPGGKKEAPARPPPPTAQGKSNVPPERPQQPENRPPSNAPQGQGAQGSYPAAGQPAPYPYNTYTPPSMPTGFNPYANYAPGYGANYQMPPQGYPPQQGYPQQGYPQGNPQQGYPQGNPQYPYQYPYPGQPQYGGQQPPRY